MSPDTISLVEIRKEIEKLGEYLDEAIKKNRNYWSEEYLSQLFQLRHKALDMVEMCS